MTFVFRATLLSIIVYVAIRSFLLALDSSHGDPYWALTLMPQLIFLFAMLEIAWSKRRFEELEPVITNLLADRKADRVRRWYQSCIKRMYGIRACAFTSAVSAPVLGYLIIYHIKWSSWIESPIVRMLDQMWLLLTLATAVSSQWPFANISLFLMRLPSKNVTINFYAHRESSIMALGAFLLQVDLGGVFLTFLCGVTLYFAPSAMPPLVYGILLIVFIWAVAWFFLTQFNIHRCMVQEKRERLEPLATKLMAGLDRLLEEPCEDSLASYNSVRNVYDVVDALPEWPFSLRNVLTLVSGVLLPIVLSVVNLIEATRPAAR